MTGERETESADDTGAVRTLRDYFAVVACLFGALFLGMIAALIACGVAQVLIDIIACALAEECDASDVFAYAETQTFIFSLYGIGLGLVASLLSLPLCAIGGWISLRFRLHPSLDRRLYTAAGFVCAALYGALLYVTVGHRWEEDKLWMFGIAMPLAGALACWGIYPMLRRPQIPNVFADE